MADTVDTLTVFSGTRKLVKRYTNVSDGTGESAVNKLDISTLTSFNGIAPTSVKIMKIFWSIQGFTSVRLFWDHTTDDEITVLGAGVGDVDYSSVGGLMDPKSTGGTGDVLLTTAGLVAGNTYDITIVFELKQ
jgi:hypothetical protein